MVCEFISSLYCFTITLTDCGQAFSTVSHLKKHRRNKHGVEEVKCTFCDRFCSSKKELLLHTDKIHKKGVYVTHYCL